MRVIGGWSAAARRAAAAESRWLTRYTWIVLLVPILAACGSSSGGGNIAWREVPTPTTIPTVVQPTLTPTQVSGPLPTPTPVDLTEAEIARYRPNELGRIPILMYHGFTSEEQYSNTWTVTYDRFRDDLTWLYEQNFYVVSMASLINNEISAPPGKHPVVLTFDDASSNQFRLHKEPDGTYKVNPRSAVGVMEQFFAEHPDFGRGGLFAVLPINCFRYDEEETTCEERLRWLDDNGYEIANHTWDHQNLADVSDQRLMDEVGSTKIWIDERVRGDGNLGNVLVLPYGNWPSQDSQVQLLNDGFVHGGQQIILAGIVGVTGGASPSPSSGLWTRWNISRFNTDPELMEYWQNLIDSGEVTLYTSDGNPQTVTIPDPLPPDLEKYWDPEWASKYGMQVIRYDVSALPEIDEASPADDIVPPEPESQGTPPYVAIPPGATPPQAQGEPAMPGATPPPG